MHALRMGITTGLLFCLSISAGAAPIEGQWVTIDDKDDSRKSLVSLAVTDGELTGTITRLLQPESQGKLCKKCPGDFNNKPIQGLQFMWGLTQDEPGQWSGGSILDPKSGKIYKAKAELAEDHNSLTVRGFIGISLFGRSQTWIRAEEETSAP
ncbi:DUF2147 domain-containing protein [Gilvimarinus xylanilyticus]|uniref:DUF2147 domain-containing protein n=1 Tax=Gilvimarinus xylanilyticus TaxID=2944139 RepID=A0A9X2HZP5_9GAMM|nr:DUF2147 domain-containing protein [Gilvimarinus xylanilyticus]MCP8901000.1 DUF2147 domain-containing protein [Gilvimarinus xylanilyticus]